MSDITFRKAKLAGIPSLRGLGEQDVHQTQSDQGWLLFNSRLDGLLWGLMSGEKKKKDRHRTQNCFTVTETMITQNIKSVVQLKRGLKILKMKKKKQCVQICIN